MQEILFRIFFNNKQVNQERLDHIEEITVEQEVDKAWEASIRMPIYVNTKGEWMGGDEDFMKSFNRIRVEIKVRDNPFVPLIDGPIVGFDSDMQAEPGQSRITVKVHDDSVYLNRKADIRRFDDKTDKDIVTEIFEEVEQIHKLNIEDTPASPETLPHSVFQRGTNMAVLRHLAKRHGKHAYVLPGEKPGESEGCFLSYPTGSNGLPSMILLGAERNIQSFNTTYNAQRPARFKASTLSFSDKKITTATSDFSDLEKLGDEQVFDKEEDTAEQVLPPLQGETVDLTQVVNAGALDGSYAYEGRGSVIGSVYSGILQPYRIVSVQGVNSILSGDYLITRVTHHLTESEYTQEFNVIRNAQSSGAKGGGITGSLNPAINPAGGLV